MSKNYMPEVAKILDVAIGEPFDVIIKNGTASPCGPFYFDENWKIRDNNDGVVPYWFLEKILSGKYAIQKRPWKPKDEDVYWVVCPNGSEDWYYFSKARPTHLAMLNMGNCFPTREAAKAAVPEMLAKFKEIKKEVRD